MELPEDKGEQGFNDKMIEDIFIECRVHDNCKYLNYKSRYWRNESLQLEQLSPEEGKVEPEILKEYLLNLHKILELKRRKRIESSFGKEIISYEESAVSECDLPSVGSYGNYGNDSADSIRVYSKDFRRGLISSRGTKTSRNDDEDLKLHEVSFLTLFKRGGVCKFEKIYMENGIIKNSVGRIGHTPTTYGHASYEYPFVHDEGGPEDFFYRNVDISLMKIEEKKGDEDKKKRMSEYMIYTKCEGIYEVEARSIFSLLRVFEMLTKNFPVRLRWAVYYKANAIFLKRVFFVGALHFQFMAVKIMKELVKFMPQDWLLNNSIVISFIYLNIPQHLSDAFLDVEMTAGDDEKNHEVKMGGELRKSIEKFVKNNFNFDEKTNV
jgi:hypothetical protein